MPFNLHTPERQPQETREAYRDRRRMSKRAVQRATLSGPYSVPGRQEPTSRERLRRDQRKNGNLRAGSFGKGLRAQITARNKMRLEAKYASKMVG